MERRPQDVQDSKPINIYLDQIAELLSKSNFFENVLFELCEESVVPEEMMIDILELQSTTSNKARILIRYITKSEEFIRTFVVVLFRKGLEELASLIDPTLTNFLRHSNGNISVSDEMLKMPHISSSSSLPSLSVIPNPSVDDHDQSQSYPNGLDQVPGKPLKIRVIPSRAIYFTHEDQDIGQRIYKNITMPRGLVFIANFETFDCDEHKKREGSEVDVQNLVELFTQMGYLVLPPKRNLTNPEMFQALRDFRENKNLQKVDSCFVVIMSHGLDNQQFYTSDNRTIRAKRVYEMFNNQECSMLINKPKVFIFNFCRGQKTDYGVERHTLKYVSNEIDSASNIDTDGIAQGETIDIAGAVPDYSDIFVVYSCLEGYVSNRNIDTGSWLIEDICTEFMNRAWNTDFEALMKLVNHRMVTRVGAGRKQPFETRNIAFNKPFFLNPIHLNSTSFPSILELGDALPQSASSSSLNRRSWYLESRSGTPEPFFESNIPASVLPTKLRHWSGGSNSSSISRDPSPFSPYASTEFPFSVRPKSVTTIFSETTRPSRRSSTPDLPERYKLEVIATSGRKCVVSQFGRSSPFLSDEFEDCQLASSNYTLDDVGVADAENVDVVDTVARKRTVGITSNDFTAWRRMNCKNLPPQECTRLKRSLSGPNEKEAMTKLKELKDYMMINNHDHLLECLDPIEEQLKKDKNKGKRRKEESNSLEY